MDRVVLAPTNNFERMLEINMLAKSRLLNIFVLCLLVVNMTLANVSVAFADDGLPPETTPTVVPTEDPATQPATETPTPDVTETPTPEESATPLPEETVPSVEETPASEEQIPTAEEAQPVSLLSQLPENTEVVVLDQSGESIPLVSQDALNAMLDTDPMWCPAGVLPGGVGCTTNFATITLLLTDMRNNTLTYDQDGVIYFTANPGASFALTTAGTSLGAGDFNTLNDFNLTLQGGWNGSNGALATFTAQTNFGTNTLTIGTSTNPWAGNITLNNFTFSGVSSSNSVTVYTTSGNITLNNVDVAQQSGDNYTANLTSNSGNITVQNGSSFDGNNSGANQNRGFRAETNTGSITITGTSGTPITFTEANGCGTLFGFCILPTLINYNGATLSAPTVTLNYVTANNNDLNGILITNANSVTLNNVTAINNGTDLLLQPNSGDAGSGVLVNGTGSTIVNVTGGSFTSNERYGVEVNNGSIAVVSSPTCSGNDLGCLKDDIPPALNLPANITTEATGPSGTVVTYTASATDSIDGALTATCTPISGSTFAMGTTTVNCSAIDLNNNTANGSFTVTVQDTTAPTLNVPANISVEATSAAGNVVTFSASASDLVAGSVPATCIPASGSTFPVGTTSVTCSATDNNSNTATGSFNVAVNDTTAPVISPHANMIVETHKGIGAIVAYASPATSDIVDGAGIASCSPVSGSLFPRGNTTVTCTATDAHGNSATPVTFLIYVEYVPKAVPTQTNSNSFIITITGGELIELDCFSVVNAFGMRVTFHNLCEHQALITSIDSDTLPAQLPAGAIFEKALNIQVLFDGQLVKELPLGTGIQLDSAIPENTQAQYAVLLWNDENKEWLDITQLMKDEELSKMLSTDAEDELYQIEPTETMKAFYRILTTEKFGTFVIVKK